MVIINNIKLKQTGIFYDKFYTIKLMAEFYKIKILNFLHIGKKTEKEWLQQVNKEYYVFFKNASKNKKDKRYHIRIVSLIVYNVKLVVKTNFGFLIGIYSKNLSKPYGWVDDYKEYDDCYQ